MLKLPVDLLQPGMILAKPITDSRGSILLRKGVPLTRDYIFNLKRRGFSSVYIADGDTKDVVIEDVIPDEVRHKTQATLAKIFDFARHVSAEFSDAHSDQIVENMKDEQVAGALRNYQGFTLLEDMVNTIMADLMKTDTFNGMMQLRSHDDFTFSHSIDMTITALMLGKRLHLNDKDLSRLGAGCLLHDIGKIFLNPNTLNAEHAMKHPLTMAEQLRLKEHPRLGYELLRTRNPDEVMANHVALSHHERQDGKGYPRNLHGTNAIERPRFDRQNILLIAEIAAVADIYDVLSAEHAGRPTLNPRQVALTMRRLAGPVLNKEIVEHFLLMLPVLPVGIPVIIKTGRYTGYQGIVTKANNQSPEKPIIRLLYNIQRDRINPIDIDLAKNTTTTVEATL